MAERRDDEPVGGARRTGRRTPGVLEIGPLSARRPGAAGTGRGGISEARAYTPRGRTVRETGLDRPADPDRPALRLVDGGPADPSAARRARTPGPRRAARSDGAHRDDRRHGYDRSDRYDRDSDFDDDHADFDESGDLDERNDDLEGELDFVSAARRRGNTSTAIPARDVSRGAPHGPKRAAAPRSRAGDGKSGPTPRRQPSRGGTPPRASRDGRPRRVRPPLRTFRPTKRLRIGTMIALLIFTVLGGRLVLLQLTDGRAYAAAGLKDRLTTTVLEARRGSIVDRNGNVLAQSLDARYVFADPTRVVNPASTAAKLRDLLGVPVSELLPKLSSKTRADGSPDEFEYLARGLDPTTAQSVQALDLPGIGTAYDQRRDEPGHDLAANLIGFTGNDSAGLAGLEEAYNKQLQGADGSHTYEVGDGNLSTELPGGYDESTPARSGSSLELTIDRDLQYEVQQVLYDHMSKAHADFAAAVVMDAHTGEVLAQASYPTFDAAAWQSYSTADRLDAATQIAVDPGSVAKLITFAGAINEGVITPKTLVPVGSGIKRGDTTYHDTHPFPNGTKLTVPGILAFSSNIGTIRVAGELGANKLYSYQQKFGFGQPTNEGLPAESGGLVQPPSHWSGSSWGSIPIGMGISVTPLQMTAAYAAIANNGTWVQPHLVKATVAADGKVTPSAAPITRAVVTPQTAATMRTLLQAVTTVKGATGTTAAVTGYQVAGKTGTGLQVSNGKYESGNVVSFVGMAPANNPRYVIGVFAHVHSGSSTTVPAPTFHDMMTFTLQHFGVPPDGAKAPTFEITGK
jgi:cell division protein FtsI (penicillin-binding protein 3)